MGARVGPPLVDADQGDYAPAIGAGLRLAEQAGGDLTIKVDKGYNLVAVRCGGQLDRLIEYEQCEIADVLAGPGGKRIVRGRHRGEQYHPKLAIVGQRAVVGVALIAIPFVDDGLQLRGRTQQQIRFKLTRAAGLSCYFAVGLRCALHHREVSARTRSIASLLSALCTFPPLKYGY